jgi:aminoglycoside phosphotransferase (APT) family kinase protein
VIDALASQPQTLLHGDWKMGNLGSHPDGRTILLDWATTGRGCVTSELMWYLAINAARLPHTKEDAIAAYRAALERHGIDTAAWWDAAVDLALLGALVQFGWEKALGEGSELAWWEEGAARGLIRL